MKEHKVAEDISFTYDKEALKVMTEGFFTGLLPALSLSVIFMSMWLSSKELLRGDLTTWWALMSYALILEVIIVLLTKNKRFENKKFLYRFLFFWHFAIFNMAVCFYYIFSVLDLNDDIAIILGLAFHFTNIVSCAYTNGLKNSAHLSYTIPCIVIAAYHFYSTEYFIHYLILTMIGIANSFGFAFKMQGFFERNIRLNAKNIELVEQLKIEKEEVEKASKAKTKFLAAASHDLRQPLQSLSLLQAALSSYLNTDQQKTVLDKAKLSLDSLNDLLDSLLDISKLDAGVTHISKTTIDLKVLLEQEIDKHRSAIESKGLTIDSKYDGDSLIFSDSIIVSRIIGNLLSNAEKYTDRGSIRIETKVFEDKAVIKIIDTGRGIPAAHEHDIFTEFFQIDNPERDRNKGLGLGLAIVKRLTELLGGKIEVASKFGQGSTFRVCLSDIRAIQDEETRPSTSTFNKEMSDLSVLVIDDEISIRESMQLLLESWGFRAWVATDLDSALTTLTRAKEASQNLDALVVDFRLRENVTGLDCIYAIRQELDYDIPALIITGDTAPERVKELENSGFQFIHKPIDPSDLRSFLASIHP